MWMLTNSPPPACRLNMAAVNRPSPAQSGPNGGNIHTRPSSGITNSGQQDPGPPFHPQHHMSARPVFYIPAPAPPPPPFLHYQWPMPFSYNPFAGFPGMGESCVLLLFQLVCFWAMIQGVATIIGTLLQACWCQMQMS